MNSVIKEKNMKKKSVLVLLVFHSILIRIDAQSIKIGDQCPDVSMEMINHPKSAARISDFRGKLLILDFWATWCGSCLSSFPKMDSLQKRFGDKLQIMPVTYEDKNKVKYLLDKMENVKNIRTASVINDSILQQYFYHSELPYYVWINDEGKVMAMTTELTAENIQTAINGNISQVVSFNQDEMGSMNPFKPLFIPTTTLYDRKGHVAQTESVAENELCFSSTLTGYRENAFSGLFGGGDEHRITVCNIGIQTLYVKAFSNRMLPNDVMAFITTEGRVIWEIKDSSLNVFNNFYVNKHLTKGNPVLFKEWLKRYSYCYEIQTPPYWGPDKKYEIMVNQMNDYFGAVYGIKGFFEKREVNGLTLVRTSKKDKTMPKETDTVFNHNPYSFVVKNQEVDPFIKLLSGMYLRKNIVDQTGIGHRINIELNCDLSNLKAVNNELAKYDLKLIDRKEMLDVIVIRQVGKNNATFSPLEEEQKSTGKPPSN